MIRRSLFVTVLSFIFVFATKGSDFSDLRQEISSMKTWLEPRKQFLEGRRENLQQVAASYPGWEKTAANEGLDLVRPRLRPYDRLISAESMIPREGESAEARRLISRIQSLRESPHQDWLNQAHRWQDDWQSYMTLDPAARASKKKDAENSWLRWTEMDKPAEELISAIERLAKQTR